jgi:hypothetical protein
MGGILDYYITKVVIMGKVRLISLGTGYWRPLLAKCCPLEPAAIDMSKSYD